MEPGPPACVFEERVCKKATELQPGRWLGLVRSDLSPCKKRKVGHAWRPPEGTRMRPRGPRCGPAICRLQGGPADALLLDFRLPELGEEELPPPELPCLRCFVPAAGADEYRVHRSFVVPSRVSWCVRVTFRAPVCLLWSHLVVSSLGPLQISPQ